MSSCQPSNLRKRACSSSSTATSSSSFLRTRHRFKRAILVAKRGGGSTTPAPTWKTMPEPILHHHHHQQQAKPAFPCKDQKEQLYVSARKLAATLWEINDLNPSRVKGGSRAKSVTVCRSGLLLPHLSDPSFTPLPQGMKGFEDDDECKTGHQLQLNGYCVEGLHAHATANLIEEEEGNQPINNKSCGKCAVGLKNRLKEARSGVSTSKKLLKVLNQMCLQEQNTSSVPLILAMSRELDRVRNQIDQLIQDQSSNQNEIERLARHFAEERKSWKRRERERIRGAIASMAEELEVERRLRRQTERLNKKIAKEIATAKASNSKVSEELEREKRAKEILQQICDELARGIGEDRAQVEKLKRESAKVREEVEKEREMLQIADVLREERVQMKLSEAKYQFEEKNAVLEKLRNELEGFLRTKEDENGDGDGNGNGNQEFKKLKDLESYLSTTCWEFRNPAKENGLDVDSDDSDLQSIELNMDNDNRSYKWSYARDESKRVSIDKDIGRKSFSERIQWGSICFNKGTAANLSSSEIQDGVEETENYRPIMSLRECLSCASPSPAIKCGQPLSLQYIDGEAEENSHRI